MSRAAIPEWFDDALCAQVDTDIFFPEKGGSVREAKQVCAGCDVRQRCLEWAIAEQLVHGVYGGKTTRERQKLAKQIELEQPAPVMCRKRLHEMTPENTVVIASKGGGKRCKACYQAANRRHDLNRPTRKATAA